MDAEARRRAPKRKSEIQEIRAVKMLRLGPGQVLPRVPQLDFDWPSFGSNPKDEENKLTSEDYFIHGVSDYKEAEISSSHFLELTVSQMNYFGGGVQIGVGAAELVLQHTIRHVTFYLNKMYKHAQEANRSVIGHEDVFSVVQFPTDTCRNFFLHFLPDPTISENEVHLRLSKIILNKYNTDPFFAQMYHSPELSRISLEKAKNMRANTTNVYFNGPAEPGLQKISFVEGKTKKSARFARKFYVLLGRPPLEKDMILVLGFMAKMCISEIVRRTIEVAGVGVPLRMQHYQRALEGTQDLLFNYHLAPVDSSRQETPERLQSPPEDDDIPEYYRIRYRQEEAKEYSALILNDRKGVPPQKNDAWTRIKAR